MPRAQWPLLRDRPIIQITLTFAQGGRKVARNLLADTGAGNANAKFEILLDENDCVLCGGIPVQVILLHGAYTGSFPVYLIPIEIPLLGFAGDFRAVGVQSPPEGLDGIAGFRFLNRFSYGNFGDRTAFGLET
jgi:hypothetical protein